MKLMRPLILSALLLNGCREQVVHNLSESDANRVVSGLHTIAVSAEKQNQKDGLWTVEVGRQDLLRSLQFLESSRILRSREEKTREKSSLISSREEQRFHLERAISAEIERTMGAIEGVRDARVHLNLPPSDPIFGHPIARVQGSASVLLLTGPRASVSANEMAAIVSGASGIALDKISVIISAPSDSEELFNEARVPQSPIVSNSRSSLLRDFGYILVAILGIVGLGLSWWALVGRRPPHLFDAPRVISSKG